MLLVPCSVAGSCYGAARPLSHRTCLISSLHTCLRRALLYLHACVWDGISLYWPLNMLRAAAGGILLPVWRFTHRLTCFMA